MLLGGANVAFAEESGGFVGIGIGGGGTELKSDMKAYDGLTEKSTTNLGGINYGFVAGYKQFFTPYLGLRYYVNLDIHHNLKKVDNVEQTFSDASGNWELTNETYLGKTRYDITTLINYGINVDFLGNFLVTEMVDFGGFIGLGIGANSLTGKFIKDLKDGFVGSGVKFSDTGFDIALNLGLRTNIAKYHGLEISARVPFMPVKMVNDSGFDEIAGGDYSFKLSFKQTFSILARYSFSF